MVDKSEITQEAEVKQAVPYLKQRKQLAVAFIVCGVFLIGLIVFAFVNLPKFQTNQSIGHLLKAYESVQEIDHYINIQAQGGQINQSFLKEKINAVSSNLDKVKSQQARDVQVIWQAFEKQLAEQNAAVVLVNDAIQLKLRLDATSASLYQSLSLLAGQLSESRAVSIETVRYIDQLANSVVRLNANINRVMSSQSQVEIKTISNLTESLSTVQKGLNVLLMGSPVDAVQSMKGLLEEENIIEAQFVFNQLARDTTSLIKDARGIVLLNQMKVQLQEEKDQIQTLLQSSIDEAYEHQQSYLKVTNQSVFWLSIIAAIGIGLFFIVFALLFLRLNKSRLFVVSEKDAREQRIDEVMKVLAEFVTLKARLLPQLEIVSSLNNESSRILMKGREVKETSSEISTVMKSMERTYEYLEQAFTHDISLLKQDGQHVDLELVRATLKKQLEFFIVRKKELMNIKQSSVLVEEFFADVVSNTNDSVIAYRAVEQELILVISEIDQLNRSLKEK